MVHGSPDNRGNLHVLEAYARLKDRLGGEIPLEIGFIEHAQPSVDDSLDLLAEKVDGVALVPLLLFDAGHSKKRYVFLYQEGQKAPSGT